MNSELSKEKLIKTIEYCTLRRASEILGCSTEDIEHYMIKGSIGGYVYLDKQAFPLSYIVGKETAEKIAANQMPPGEIDILLYGSKPSASTELSAISYGTANDPNFNTECWGPDVTPYASGIWCISDRKAIKDLVQGNNVSGVRVTACNPDGSLDQPDFLETLNSDVWDRTIQVDNVSKSDLYLIQSDLLKIYNALYNEQPMVTDSSVDHSQLMDAILSGLQEPQAEPVMSENKASQLPEYLAEIQKLLEGQHEYHAPELVLAIKVWLDATKDPDLNHNNVLGSLNKFIPSDITSEAARSRIKQVANWNKKGNAK
ncbi:hypothetical protein [Vibrio proteolyticus]